MAASIRFEQDSENFDPVSTDEGVLDEVVTLSNFSNTGVNAWRWVLLDKPEGSSATISTALRSCETAMTACRSRPFWTAQQCAGSVARRSE